MYRFTRLYRLILIFLFLSSCVKTEKTEFKFCFPGCWKKLLAFGDDEKQSKNGFAWLSVSFNTLDDSVFYDSHNDLRDRFYFDLDSVRTISLFGKALRTLSEGDSALFLLSTNTFFNEQFHSKSPHFCSTDSVIRVYVKLKKMFSPEEFTRINNDFRLNEEKQILSYFGSNEDSERAKDPTGFYWVERPEYLNTEPYSPGESFLLNYSGGFLNGRIIDHCSDFTFIYGTPDQILNGLNYVIPKLKKGQTAKIILPSSLAFGETGSSNGSVPPYTPMLYKLSIN